MFKLTSMEWKKENIERNIATSRKHTQIRSHTLFIPFHFISMLSHRIHFTHSDFILTHYLLTINFTGSLINRILHLFTNMFAYFFAAQLTI